jgi:hypothetical protein
MYLFRYYVDRRSVFREIHVVCVIEGHNIRIIRDEPVSIEVVLQLREPKRAKASHTDENNNHKDLDPWFENKRHILVSQKARQGPQPVILRGFHLHSRSGGSHSRSGGSLDVVFIFHNR